MLAPKPRGRLSMRLHAALMDDPDVLTPTSDDDGAEDRAIALWTLHELHHRGFEDVDERHELSPSLLALRRDLEDELEHRLRERWAAADVPAPTGDVGQDLFDLAAAHDGASVAGLVRSQASAEQVRELLRLRAVYHLHESDPTTWQVPRLPVRAKAALMEVQYDEYGAGDPNRLHHQLFAQGLAESGLDPTYGVYVDEAPLEILEQNNTVRMFGLQRRLRGAAMGHLAAFEATSSVPSRRMVQGLERLGFGPAMVGYYREHVAADAVHDQLAARVVCATLVEDEPALAEDVRFGAWTCLDLEDRVARMVTARWQESA
jgi:hypothetical protein